VKRIIPIVAIAAVAAAFATKSYWLPVQNDKVIFLGYVESETTLISPPTAGRLVELNVTRGQSVNKGATLFSLDQIAADAEVERTKALLQQARAQFENLATGKREEELDIIRAQRREAEAALRYAESELNRTSILVPTGATSRARFDQATSQVTQLREKIASLKSEEAAGGLGGRRAERDAAEAKIKESEAAVVQAEKVRGDNAPVAPVAARVDDTFFEPGEWVPAGNAVVSLLASDRIKLRFFVPQDQVSHLTPGTTITFRCDGCPADQRAVVNYVASRAEFTPPVIYSADSRTKLVFLVEAKPLQSTDALRPGLPIEVEPSKEAAP
jgi:HlyD family secretion protein